MRVNFSNHELLFIQKLPAGWQEIKDPEGVTMYRHNEDSPQYEHPSVCAQFQKLNPNKNVCNVKLLSWFFQGEEPIVWDMDNINEWAPEFDPFVLVKTFNTTIHSILMQFKFLPQSNYYFKDNIRIFFI